MSRIVFVDCFSGVSGDMLLGALVDAGVDVDRLRGELGKLGVEGWQLAVERSVRYGIAGTRLRVHAPEQHTHRHLSDIAGILDASALDSAVKRPALAIFTRLAEAEAAVHGTSSEDVHFHEVGALDAIVDIVGVVIALRLLEVEAVYASALPLGSGWIETAHGRLPVPPPAVLELLGAVHAPLLADDTPAELVTPTGAAILAELATFARPAMTLQTAGYGFGSRDIGRLNAVRVWIGEAPGALPAAAEARDHVLLLETNIDDQAPEQLAYVAERLLAGGALDVWWTPIGMKKGRSATMLSALVRLSDETVAVETIFRETTSLGIRRRALERWVCQRTLHSVATPWGMLRVKEQRWQGARLGVAPEYEDCAQAAKEHNIPLRTVYAYVQAAAGEQLPP